jgi:hypothetical protein
VFRSGRLAIALLLLLVAIARRCTAQGGPPMITDDPGTPGNRKWEINLAVALDHRLGETSLDLPAIDLNYGVGENIQLTLQTAPVLFKSDGRGPIGGLGGTEAAVKWRFLDEETCGVDASMFPRLIFNVVQSSIRRGLAEDGTRFQIPFQFAKNFGVFRVDMEAGALVSTVGRSGWLYGVVGGIEVSKTTMLMAELHGTSRTNFTHDALVVNFGRRHEFSETRILITSLGHEVRSTGNEPLAWIGYFGMQLIY